MAATDKAKRHAQEFARRGGTVEDCAYKNKIWRAIWLKAFKEAQQQELFKKGDSDE